MDSLPKKLLIAYNIILKGGMNDNSDGKFQNEPINELLTNYEELENIIKSRKDRIYLFLYFTWNKVGTDDGILYNESKLINLNELLNKNNNLSELFYLDLMINDDILNYFKISLEFIENINNMQNLINDEVYKKVIYSKIIIDLIKNFNQDEENVSTENLEKIEEFNKKILEDNLSEFNFLILGLK